MLREYLRLRNKRKTRDDSSVLPMTKFLLLIYWIYLPDR